MTALSGQLLLPQICLHTKQPNLFSKSKTCIWSTRFGFEIMLLPKANAEAERPSKPRSFEDGRKRTSSACSIHFGDGKNMKEWKEWITDRFFLQGLFSAQLFSDEGSRICLWESQFCLLTQHPTTSPVKLQRCASKNSETENICKAFWKVSFKDIQVKCSNFHGSLFCWMNC